MPFYTDTLPNDLDIRATGIGILTENFNSLLGSNATAPATGTVWGVTFGLRAGQVVTGIKLRNQVAAAGSKATLARFGLAQWTGAAMNMIGPQSADLSAAANWPLGECPFPFSSTYTVPTTGAYMGCFLVVGTWGTTQPTPVRAATNGNAQTSTAPDAPVGIQWAGQSDLPAAGSPLTLTTGLGTPYYMALY